MNRRFTNLLRFFMDECLPPVLRDSKYFMLPFYYFAYRGKNIKEVMEFKSRVYEFTAAEYQQFYAGLDSVSRNRPTDLNDLCIEKILDLLAHNTGKVLDVGCGSGYLLKQIQQRYPALVLAGADIIAPPASFPFKYIQSDILALQPYSADARYDVVTCCHTLEHILELPAAVAHLRQLCRCFLVVVVPCQRYFYYTLDEHIHFFTHQQQLAPMLGLKMSDILGINKLGGDWLLVIKSSNG